MSSQLDLYLATSGPYRLAFVSTQIASVAACPRFDIGAAHPAGMLGTFEGMQVVHPGWFWGHTQVQQPPRFLLVLRSGGHALAVDSYRHERLPVQPAPVVCTARGAFYGIVGTSEGLTPVLDLACVPLS